MLREVLLPAHLDLSQAPAAHGHKDAEAERRARARDDVTDLIALLPIPSDVKLPDAVARAVETRRPRVLKQRESVSPAAKKTNFCAAPGEQTGAGDDL
jgi:hypothetical protein